MISEPVKSLIITQLREPVIAVTSVSGGSINRVYCLQTVTQKFLIKLHKVQ